MNRKPSFVVSIVILFLAICDPLFAQNVAIGQASASPGETVALPIMIDGTANTCAGLLLRLNYDPEVLEAPTAFKGAILADAHVLDVYSPIPGRINLFIAGLLNSEPFTAQSGIVASLQFTIKADAANDYSDVTLTAIGTPGMPALSLVDTSGDYVEQTFTPGRITIKSELHDAIWEIY